jgi:poly-gamma-glutamate biosynthesis protein PgsC/CapC
MISFAVGLGMVFSWLSFELFGVSAGGLVVPGYLAFFITSPLRIAITFGLALLVVGVIRILERYLVLYGRRRFVVTVLLGFVAGSVWRSTILLAPDLAEFYAVGLIIPGLLAYEMDRQGVISTSLAALAVAGLVRLCLGWLQ